MNVQYVFHSPFGPVYLVASEMGLQQLVWHKRTVPCVENLEGKEPAVKFLRDTVKQLTEYFAGKRREFSVPLDVGGTAFQKKVWAALAKIPYGKTVSYSDIARGIQNKNAVRAVGTANGRNPVSIIVPCHRVIQHNGTLGGYAGGLPVKVKLLGLEGCLPE